MATLLFFLDEHQLTVFVRRRKFVEPITWFCADDDGRREFSIWLSHQARSDCIFLVDTGAEEFRDESIPRLGQRERAALTRRRQAQLFRETPYVHALHQVSDEEQERILYVGLMNAEWLDAWLACFQAARQPLKSVISASLLMASVFERLGFASRPGVLACLHETRLNQLVFDRYGLKLSRSVLSGPGGESRAERLHAEAERARAFLENEADAGVEPPETVVIAPEHDQIWNRHATSTADANYYSPARLLQRLGFTQIPADCSLEAMYAVLALFVEEKNHYATPSVTRHYRDRRIGRRMLSAAAFMSTLAFGVGYSIHDRTHALLREADTVRHALANTSEALRQGERRLEMYPAPPSELKQVVDLYREAVLPWPELEPSVRHLAQSITRHPQLQFETLDWSVSADPVARASAADHAQGRRYGLTIEFAGYVTAKRSDYRTALNALEQFRKDIEGRRCFRLEWSRLPLDHFGLRPGQPFDGSSSFSARFSGRLTDNGVASDCAFRRVMAARQP